MPSLSRSAALNRRALTSSLMSRIGLRCGKRVGPIDPKSDKLLSTEDLEQLILCQTERRAERTAPGLAHNTGPSMVRVRRRPVQ